VARKPLNASRHHSIHTELDDAIQVNNDGAEKNEDEGKEAKIFISHIIIFIRPYVHIL